MHGSVGCHPLASRSGDPLVKHSIRYTASIPPQPVIFKGQPGEKSLTTCVRPTEGYHDVRKRKWILGRNPILREKERRYVLDIAHGWTMDVDRGPDWLFVRLHGPKDTLPEDTNLAETLWNLLRQHFTNRLVLELDDVPMLRSHFIGQLVLLQKRIHMDGGLMRLCGLSSNHQEALTACRLRDRFPNYCDREAAVMGHRPGLPR